VAKVTMPQLGESVAEGTIGKWLKQPGDSVEKYEPLLEVITDKVNAEVPSPFAGVLKEILVEEGATVPNNAEIAVIETADEAGGAATDAPAPATEAPKAEPAPAPAPAPEAAAAPVAAAPVQESAHGPAGSDERPERAAASAAAAAPTAVATEAPGNADARTRSSGPVVAAGSHAKTLRTLSSRSGRGSRSADSRRRHPQRRPRRPQRHRPRPRRPRPRPPRQRVRLPSRPRSRHRHRPAPDPACP
jgi:pyruvate/2-oxoglutarate dehydrogenase complex dihydrolipoamide acyltransferase (E2) component